MSPVSSSAPSPGDRAAAAHEPAGLLSSDPLIAMLERAHVDRSSLILLTGPSGLSALLWLCRHGYERVGYLRPGAGSHEPADALIVAHTCDDSALERLLSTGPHVREGGVMVFQSPLPRADAERADPVHRLLRRHGYAIEQCHHGCRRALHVARRGWRQAFRRAA